MTPPSPRALFFDFDGVLVNTEPLHMRAWVEILTPLGMGFTHDDYYKRYIGLNDRDFLTKIFAERAGPAGGGAHTPARSARGVLTRRRHPPPIIQKLIQQKEKRSREFLSKDIPLIEGSGDFLKKAFEKKYPMALVTGALASEVYFILDRMDWRKYFSAIVTANDVEKGKPDPEGYLKAFEKISAIKKWDPPLKKSECLIFEDSGNGIQAAKHAGIPHQIVRGRLVYP